jgi:hypothetical protein
MVRQGAACDGEVEAMTDLVVHGCRAVSVMKIKGRGERGRPVREGRLAVASGGKRGGHETHKRYCIFFIPTTKASRAP